MTEPASVKQARLAKEKASQFAKREAEQKQLPKQQPKLEQKPVAEKAKEINADPRYYWHQVTQVVDGDTVKARVDGKEESIRIIGINSPESTTSSECYGPEASAKAKEFLQGKWIQIEQDSSQDNRDKYSRLLRYVWFDNGTDFGRRMIEEGYAFEYTYNTAYQKQNQYKETQKAAQSKTIGLWASNTCNGQKQKPVTQASPTTTTPAPKSNPSPAPTSNCDPNYTPCIPYIAGNTLNCPDIQVMVRVIGVDHNKFDANGDGYGCESYQ
jgi:micrococcal nuclease